MRIVILGGYGVFGARMARLLARDGHALWIAGRNYQRAAALAAEIGAQALRIDRAGDLSPLANLAPDVVIDAAGPFQFYRDDPYRLPRYCLGFGASYLDLSDSAAFTAGIAALDREARQAGLWLLSGASSVPGVSSAVVRDLAEGFDTILDIDIAILPGNRAPRGASVMASIVNGVGRPAKAWRGGLWRAVRGWTEARRYTLAPGLTRRAYFTEVPDIRLFPEAFVARSVMFRAGLELGILNRALGALAWLRRYGRFPVSPPMLHGLRWFADRLQRFGSDRGGMQVAVTGRVGGRVLCRRWTLIAEAGQGPFVPGVAARALLRRAARIKPGARPCLAEVGLAEIAAAMDDLAISTSRDETPHPPLFQAVLAENWPLLAPEVQALHKVHEMESFSGRARVTRGASLLALLAGFLFRFPAAGEDVPVTVTMTQTDAGETWIRNFAGRAFRSHISPSAEPNRIRERFGPFAFELDLPVAKGSLSLPVRRGWFLGVPLPRLLLPGSDSREFTAEGRFHFDVALSAPFGAGLIVRYRGWLVPDASAASSAPRPS